MSILKYTWLTLFAEEGKVYCPNCEGATLHFINFKLYSRFHPPDPCDIAGMRFGLKYQESFKTIPRIPVLSQGGVWNKGTVLRDQGLKNPSY